LLSDVSLISLTIFAISSVASLEFSASFLISSATTANPFPCSPALAASIDALSAKRFVCSVILLIVSSILLIFADLDCSSNIASSIFIIDSLFSVVLTLRSVTTFIPLSFA
jgi:hypothetical protein